MSLARFYDAQVEEVHSGDDLVLMVNLGVDGLFKRVRARLHGVDTPNAFRAKTNTEAGEVRDEVRRLTLGACRIEIVVQGKGGWLVVLHAEVNGGFVSVNDILKSRGYIYRGKDNQKESEGTL